MPLLAMGVTALAAGQLAGDGAVAGAGGPGADGAGAAVLLVLVTGVRTKDKDEGRRTEVLLNYRSQGSASDETVVLLHGWPDSCHSYSRVMPLIPRLAIMRSRRTCAGSATRTSPRPVTPSPSLAADVVALLDALGIERATVVGHSFGSFVARRVAEAYPGRVSRLVLIGSGFRAANDVTRSVLDELRTLPDPVPESFARAFQASTIHIPLPEGFFDELISESLKLPSRLCGPGCCPGCWRLTMWRRWDGCGVRRCCCGAIATRSSRAPIRTSFWRRCPTRACASTRRRDIVRTGSAPTRLRRTSCASSTRRRRRRERS